VASEKTELFKKIYDLGFAYERDYRGLRPVA
jgi:hypothetical protein